ncbi:class I SAM-dependent methyltransferase [Sphingosinicella sp. LHD-64]|uniref:class I SAM-dependent methyltransferase n=1 Tax=Sphingosinicella sp. LHD-64 TaxID=3072139 RepID=UPI00280E8C7E|nr:class I SAM-dependent methyltransferase [Sphingosinicella sp. LHD-64]MDQ8757172.1 class I SAM-dependent methyltransferase [Sphingosinicella sp. LHD-64]
MTNLLIHSMSEFSDIILKALALAEAREIVEIGAEFGGMSFLLADHAEAQGGRLTSIDPSPKQEFLDWGATRDHFRHVAKPSLEAFDEVVNVDAWIIDGDHNWYTVYHELKGVDAACRRDGKPLLAFLHDIAWPCARRDLYYAPDRIPAEFRHAYTFEGGVFPGISAPIPNRGFRGMGQFACALHEGGPRNGVMTAIEDFIEELRAEGRGIAFAEVPAVFGLGILFDTDAPWGPDMAGLVIPWHENKLLRRLEENRLANYLTVLEWQDRVAAGRRAA